MVGYVRELEISDEETRAYALIFDQGWNAAIEAAQHAIWEHQEASGNVLTLGMRGRLAETLHALKRGNR